MSDIVTLSEWKAYIQEAATDNDSLFSVLVSAVSEMVQAYLGRSLITPSTAETVLLDGRGKADLDLPQFPVLTSPAIVVVEDGLTLMMGATADFLIYANQGYLKRVNGVWSKGFQNISVTYKYGYAIGSVPAPIKLVCFRELGRRWNEGKLKEWGERSRSFADGSSSHDEVDELMEDSKQLLNRYRRLKV